MRKYILCLLISFISIKSYTQTNQLDTAGLKTGLWFENIEGFKYETYYNSGVKNGIEKVYYRNSVLMALLEYENGQLKGKGYFFDETSHLSFTIKYNGRIKTKNGLMIKGYYTVYKQNGKKKSEGYGLSESGNEYEMGKIGDWKYYK